MRNIRNLRNVSSTRALARERFGSGVRDQRGLFQAVQSIAGDVSCVFGNPPRTMVGQTDHGHFTAIPVLMPEGPRVHMIRSGQDGFGKAVGYVHFDLQTGRWAISDELHGTFYKIRYSTITRAIETLQAIRNSKAERRQFASA